MKNIVLTTLRNKNTPTEIFRQAAENIGIILANETSSYLAQETISITTPLAKTSGKKFKNNIILVPILRSGIALLNPFIRFFEQAQVGFVGLRRDEKTAIAQMYYYKVPAITSNNRVILLDPMIATGGSALDALAILKKAGAQENQIIFAAVIASKEGLEKIKKIHPNIQIIVIQIDETLNDKKYIIPGLGDFGDRYFGTEEKTITM